jgi:hypothetical protein
MIPGATLLTGPSGYSLAGTVANALSANTDKAGPHQMGWIDPQRSMQKDEKTAFLNTNLLSLLFGVQAQDVNRPSYQKMASKGG